MKLRQAEMCEHISEHAECKGYVPITVEHAQTAHQQDRPQDLKHTIPALIFYMESVVELLI